MLTCDSYQDDSDDGVRRVFSSLCCGGRFAGSGYPEGVGCEGGAFGEFLHVRWEHWWWDGGKDEDGWTIVGRMRSSSWFSCWTSCAANLLFLESTPGDWHRVQVAATRARTRPTYGQKQPKMSANVESPSRWNNAVTSSSKKYRPRRVCLLKQSSTSEVSFRVPVESEKMRKKMREAEAVFLTWPVVLR